MAEAAGVSAAPERPATARARVLVKERIAEGGVELLRERFDVDVEIDMPADELADRIAGYDALIVRSATAVDADLLARAERLKVVGRAGTGVDNVDVAEATRRGIIVANAPGSNMVSAAEHAIGLLLSLARNIPQAHSALSAGPLGALPLRRRRGVRTRRSASSASAASANWWPPAREAWACR